MEFNSFPLTQTHHSHSSLTRREAFSTQEAFHSISSYRHCRYSEFVWAFCQTVERDATTEIPAAEECLHAKWFYSQQPVLPPLRAYLFLNNNTKADVSLDLSQLRWLSLLLNEWKKWNYNKRGCSSTGEAHNCFGPQASRRPPRSPGSGLKTLRWQSERNPPQGPPPPADTTRSCWEANGALFSLNTRCQPDTWPGTEVWKLGNLGGMRLTT